MTTQNEQGEKNFPLLRYFSLTSLAALGIVALILGIFYQRLAERNILEVGESKNVAITQSLSNSVWPQFSEFLISAENLDGDQIRLRDETDQIYDHVFEQMNGLSVLKVKIYAANGNTIFSTEYQQIGDDKSTNEGFLTAYAGQVASELTHRDTFSAFEQTISDRDVISSYVPITRDGEIVGVFEVYDDVTSLVTRIDQTQLVVGAVVVGSFLLLYLVLFYIVRQADQIITRQRVLQEKSNQELLVTYQALEAETAKGDQTYQALQLETQKVARVHEFFKLTLEHMMNTLERGGTSVEMTHYLNQVKQEFDRLE